jgi:lysozyme
VQNLVERFRPGRILVVLATLAVALLSVLAVPSGATAAAPAKAGGVKPLDGIPYNCNYAPAPWPTISWGSTGPAVKQAQCYLNDSLKPWLHTPLVVDGQFGPKTDAAVRTFQGCAGIGVDGIVGPVTWSKLQYWADQTVWLC